MNDANKVFKGISFFLVLLKLPYVSFKFFLFIHVFFREHSRFTGQQGKGKKREVCVFEGSGGGVGTLMHTMSYLLTLNIF